MIAERTHTSLRVEPSATTPQTMREWLTYLESVPTEYLLQMTRIRLKKKAWGLYRDSVMLVPEVTVGSLTLRPDHWEAVYRGECVTMTGREMQVLLVLAKATEGGQALRPEHLTARVWGDGWDLANARSCITSIRHKFSDLIVSRSVGGLGRGRHCAYYLDVFDRESS